MANKQKKRKGSSVQDLIGIKTFTKYGLLTNKGELLFYLVQPTNISVLSYTNIEIKVRHLMMVLSTIPDIEITCTDSSECFDDNKIYMSDQLDAEQNPRVKKLLKKDIEKTLAYTLEDAIAKLHKQNYNYVIRTKGKTQTLPLDEILYFESYKRYVTIYTSHENYKQYRKISDLEQELLEYGFGRIYKSYLVNWKHVQTIENGKALMDNGIRLTCSRTNYQEIIRQYILWVGRES